MPIPARFTGYALAAAGAALFSTKAIFVKLAYQERVDGALMLAWRMLFSLPVFIVVGIWAYRERQRQGKPPPSRAAVSLASLTGFFGYYAASQFDFAGLQYISAQLERLVLFTYPIFIMLLGAMFFGQPLRRSALAAAAVTYAGLAIVFASDYPAGGRATVIGTLLVLGAAITFAIHHLLAKKVLPDLGSALFTAIALTVAGILCVAHQLLLGEGGLSASPRFLMLSALCALVATVAPTFLISAGIARTSPQAVAMISNISPLVTISLSVIILGEPFTLVDAIGAALVLSGIALFTWGDRAPAREELD